MFPPTFRVMRRCLMPNPYHDKRGRFTTKSGSSGGASMRKTIAAKRGVAATTRANLGAMSTPEMETAYASNKGSSKRMRLVGSRQNVLKSSRQSWTNRVKADNAAIVKTSRGRSNSKPLAPGATYGPNGSNPRRGSNVNTGMHKGGLHVAGTVASLKRAANRGSKRAANVDLATHVTKPPRTPRIGSGGNLRGSRVLYQTSQGKVNQTVTHTNTFDKQTDRKLNRLSKQGYGMKRVPGVVTGTARTGNRTHLETLAKISSTTSRSSNRTNNVSAQAAMQNAGGRLNGAGQAVRTKRNKNVTSRNRSTLL